MADWQADLADVDGDWALCVGVGTYEDGRRLVALPGALNDATAIHDWLVDPLGGGVRSDRAELILSPSAQEIGMAAPTADRIELFLRFMHRRASANEEAGNGFRAGRRLWLFFAGHGVRLGDDDAKDTGLLSADARLPGEFPHVAGMAWAEVFRVTAAFLEVVLFMDCCRTDANRIALRKPAVSNHPGIEGGRMIAAFAAHPNRASLEVLIGGRPRGKFTHALEELLKNPPMTPISAKQFLEHLEHRYPDVDPVPPRRRDQDFELIPHRDAGAASAPTLLVAHGESTASLARGLAADLASVQRPTRPGWIQDIHASPADVFASVQELIITRDVDLTELEALVDKIRPERTVLFSATDPGVEKLKDVRFVPRADADSIDLRDSVSRLDAALCHGRGQLEVVAADAVARIRVWDQHGRPVASRYGNVVLAGVPTGKYRARASLGAGSDEATTEVHEQIPGTIVLRKLAPQLTTSGTLVHEGSVASSELVVMQVKGDQVLLSLPKVAGWRAEVFSMSADRAEPSVRLVPDTHPVGATYPSDDAREALRLALAEPGWDAEVMPRCEFVNDPIAALLAAALRLRGGFPHLEYVEAAAKTLGDDNVDVRLLRGNAGALSVPPLLAYPWHMRLREGTLAVRADSRAESVADRLWSAPPWFAWSDTPTSDRSWLTQVANVAWPGWDAAPQVALALDGLDGASQMLGAPASSVRNRSYKAVPIDRLVQHERAAFLGASNDQLPAALAVAFVERGRKRWRSIAVWSLTDAPLAAMLSAGRTGAVLLGARDGAERRLLELLPLVADEWSVVRYAGLDIATERCFVSLWDWEAVGGLVHISPLEKGEDVRTAGYGDFIWKTAAPPHEYQLVVAAFDTLRTVEVRGKA